MKHIRFFSGRESFASMDTIEANLDKQHKAKDTSLAFFL